MAAAASPQAPRLAYTGERGNIFIATSRPDQPRQLTWSWEEPSSDEAPRLSHI